MMQIRLKYDVKVLCNIVWVLVKNVLVMTDVGTKSDAHHDYCFLSFPLIFV